MDKAKKKFDPELFVVIALYLAGIAVNMYIAVKNNLVMNFYPDESLYFGLAESIHNGDGLTVYNAPVTFNNILYSIIISPAFALPATGLRLPAIYLINNVLINAGIFPVYYLSRRLIETRWCRIAAYLIYAVYSYNYYGISFLTESLWIPLMLWLICLFFNIFTRQDELPLKKLIFLNIGAGALTYVCYFTKVVSLAVPIAYAAYLFTELIFRFFRRREGIRDFFRTRLAQFIGYAATFAVPYVIFRFLVFSNVTNYAFRTSLFSEVDDAVQYMIYAFMFYICAVAVTLLVLPLLMPAVYFDKLSKNAQRLFTFLFWLLVISAAVTVFTVTLPEDYPDLDPRTHLRYICWIFLPFIIVFLHLAEKNTELDRKAIAHKAGYMALLFLPMIAVFRGTTRGSEIDNTMFIIRGSGGNALTALIFVFMFICAVCLFMYHYKKTRNGMMIALLLCLTLAAQGYDRYKGSNIFINARGEVSESHIEISDIVRKYSRFIDEHPDDTFLFIDTGFNSIITTRDTYIGQKNVYKTMYKDMLDNGIEIEGFVPGETEFPIYFRFSAMTEYEPMHIDYLVSRTALQADDDCENCEEIEELSSDVYTMYKLKDCMEPVRMHENPDMMYSGDYLVCVYSTDAEDESDR